jgi:D-tyrosyl-tRNA(Tyr) deacylase
MIAVLQRVSHASVETGGHPVASIGCGILVLVCAVKGDTDLDLEYTARKIIQLRIFEDETGRMSRSLADVSGEVLVVSQFTLAAMVRKGNRPSFDRAEGKERARTAYEDLVARLRRSGVPVSAGVFEESMQVHLVNDGPVTVIVDSRDRA